MQVQKVRTATRIIAVGSINIVQEEEEEKAALQKKEMYNQLARAVDEYIADTIIAKKNSGFSLEDIAEHLGLDLKTVIHFDDTNVQGAYQYKSQQKLTNDDRAERNRIIIELWNKGLRRCAIAKRMDISPGAVGGVVDRNLGKKR